MNCRNLNNATLFGLVICLGMSCMGKDLHAGDKMRGPYSLPATKAIADSQTTKSVLFTFYKKYISPVDGDRCAMHPSCSRFANDAVGQFGVVKGVLLTCDRLTRCGNDMWTYPTVFRDGLNLFFDPVVKRR